MRVLLSIIVVIFQFEMKQLIETKKWYENRLLNKLLLIYSERGSKTVSENVI